MIINNKQYSAIIIAICLIACVWGLRFFAVFSLLNGFAYDTLTRTTLTSQTSTQLLVIDGDKQDAERGDELWLPLLKTLINGEVKQVVFNFLPAQVSADFYQLAADSGKVVFAQQALKSNPYTAISLQSLPEAAKNKNIRLGLINLPQSQHGIYRMAQRVINMDGRDLPTLEYSAAQRVIETSTPTTPDYRINFIGGTEKIPKINLKQAVSGSLISELIAGRSVLVGIHGMDALANYATPLSADSRQTADVLFHAFALDTLLNQADIHHIADWVLLVIIISITLATLIFCQELSFQHSFILAIILTISYVLACWFILQRLFFWVPLVELLVAQWLSYAIAWRYRVAQEKQVLASSLFNLSVSLQEKAFPVSFYASQDPWAQLIIMINESLPLKRMIFLERIVNDHRLKEIKAFQCSIDDVIEVRRDYERTPYSTVIQEHKPLLQKTPYLTPVETAEQQYLAPLIFASEVLGFWAFTVEPNEESSSVKFHALTYAYMQQISEILYYRQEWKKRTARENNKLLSYLSFTSDTKSSLLLNQSLALLNRRISELQEVFNHINTGGVLYDLFGRVLLINKHMESLAQTENLKLYTMTALEFITAVTAYDVEHIRKIMQKVIFDREIISIPITHFKSDHDYILHIQPLKIQNNSTDLDNSTPVFQITGILCELEDMTELKSIFRLKEQIFERCMAKMQSNLSDIAVDLAYFEHNPACQQQNLQTLQYIHDKIQTTQSTLSIVNKQLSKEIEDGVFNYACYPINGQEVINKAITALKDYAAIRAVKLNRQSPAANQHSLVFASAKELYSVFHAVLKIIIDDTFEGANLWVTVEETKQTVQYIFHNEGIGIVTDNAQHPNESTRLLANKHLHMDEIIHYIKHWDGKIDVSSQVGKGTVMTIELKRFL